VAEPLPGPRRDVMPRVRIGLTGLACVFLLVLIAAALFGNQRTVRHLTPEEPLAELGVTPGGAPTIKANDAKPPSRQPLAEPRLAPGGNRAPRIAGQTGQTSPVVAPVRTASPAAH
jgi:hypothetical protein